MDTRMTSPPGGHAWLYDAAMWPFERAGVSAWRRRLAARARGRVVEIGAGSGSQLRWYAPGTVVTAVEPDPSMAARARRRAASAAAAVTVLEAHAEELPLAGGSFDAAVVTFALCTVADPGAALAELRRVLVPGAPLLLLEHVHLPWQPGRWLQSRAAPAWAGCAGGCRLDRDTEGGVRAAGFEILERRPHVLGWIVEVVARSPGAPGAAR
jgi:SAM-dependent methyltransferase